jgi:hypothetical protein
MLFTWADDRKVQEDIMKLESMEKIYRFFSITKRNSRVLFVIDQDLEIEGTDPISNSARQSLRSWIDKFTFQHKTVFSASANYKARVRMELKQTNEMRLSIYGGFSAVSPIKTC